MNDSDFIGFSFNGIHSDTLHIKRVSDGSRYNDTLSPNFQDVKAQVPGRDGTLYWDSFYSEKQFPVQVAFDELSESGLRTLRQTFNGKVEGWLIFDESPYKQYWVKIQNPPQFKYLCFYDENNERVYKGEGTINFVAYDVYGHAKGHNLSSYRALGIENLNEWKDSTGMRNSDDRGEGAVAFDQPSSSTVSLHDRVIVQNSGDVECDWVAIIPLTATETPDFSLRRIRLSDNAGTWLGDLRLDNFTRQGTDQYLIIDSRTELIEGARNISYDSEIPTCGIGYAKYDLTGTLYNEYISSGDFFKIPKGVSPSDVYALRFWDGESNPVDADLYYDLLYY